uniref:Nucleotidyl transferase domain-containing protein n=1 Tax=Denticeps clupeoides TaxID=299321 RepID=A0AAY4EG12_9TELE
MKAVILAAGYGTRLQRDIDSDRSGHFQHLAGVAKPLLPVGRCALISHWASVLTRTGCVDGIFVVTNALHHEAFQTWAQEFPNVRVLSDGTRANEDRLGALACLQLTIGHFSLDDHLIVIGGDTLFKEDFSLLKFMGRFSELQAECGDSSLVLTYRCKDEETSKYGILEVDHDLRATCMLEKPRPSETQSRKACPCFYLLSRTCLPLLPEFLHEKKFSNLAILEPNCMARLGRTADASNPNSFAAILSRSFSPKPRGKDRSIFSHTGRPFKKLTTSSSK